MDEQMVQILEEMKSMKAEIDRLNFELERAQAVNDIQRLMGDYFNTHVVNPNEPVNHLNQWDYFADREDSTYEVANFGLLRGFKNIQFFFKEKIDKVTDENGNFRTGLMFEHDLCSPQIVVAADGQTARGVWTSPGHETAGMEGLHAEWAWGRVAADFLKVDGEWKIWHYHWYRLFRVPFGTPWTEFDQMSVSRPIDKERVRQFGGDPDNIFPSTYFHPYSTDTFVECTPRTPQPYETWTEDMLPV